MYFKGIVMEVKESYSLIMKDDGRVVRVSNKPGMEIGQKIFFTEEDVLEYRISEKSEKAPKRNLMAFIAVAAAIILMIIPLFRSGIPITKSYAMISFDINPSLSIKVDKNQTILNVEGINDDAKELDLDSLKGKTLAEGSEILRNAILNSSDITNKESVIVGFTFLEATEDIGFEDDIKEVLNNNFQGFNVMYLKGNKDDLKMAEEKGVSLGKYEAMLKLDDDILEEELEKLSVPELMDLLKEYSNMPYLDEEMKEEIQDEIEDKIEDMNEKDDDDDNDEEDDDNDDDNNDDDNNDND